MGFKAFFNWFIPEELKINVISYNRSKILVGVAIFFSVIVGASASRGFMVGNQLLGITIALSALTMLLSLFILKSTGSLNLSGNLFILSFAVMLTVASYHNGGTNSQNQYNFAILIIIAFLICGLKNGLFWGVFSLSVVVIFKVMKANGYEFPPILETEIFVNLFSIIFIVLVFAFIFELSNSSNLKNFVSEKSKADKTANLLRLLFADINQVMSAVSEGDLSQRVSVEVEGELSTLMQNINMALIMLGQTISQVRSATGQIDAGTSQVSSSAQILADGSNDQAASLEEISSSMDEIGSKAKTNSENAQQAQALSKKTSSEVAQSNRQMEEMLSSMKKINETSTDVSKVIKVIDEIAFQTNLLALNAAVEAARAGKYGKGFAVVAEEVRNLASRSAEAAKDTTQLIESSIKEVENGVVKADQTAEILKGFIDSINKVTNIVDEISIVSQNQASSAYEVNTSLERVNNVVQQNSSISEETASTSQELSSQAEILMNLMNRFKTSNS